MSGRLTKAQLRVLKSTADGVVNRYFDVWTGYWWAEGRTRLPCFMRGSDIPPLPIQALLRHRLICEDETKRVYDGFRVTPYLITDKGCDVLHNRGRL